MYLRPYTAVCDQNDIDIIGNRVQQAGGSKITSDIVTGVASRVIRPDANPHSLIHIPSGWNEQRVSFIMEVHVEMPTQTTSIYYFQGYTNYCGLGTTNTIDPQMLFIINSFMQVSRVPRLIDGQVQHIDTVIKSAQVINGKIMNQSVHGGYRMAPCNLFHGSQSSGINAAYKHYKNEAIDDTRVHLGLESYGSDRTNNIASGYLAKILEAQSRVSQTMGIGNGFHDVADMQYGFAYEPPVNENPFIAAISRLEHQMCTTEFTMNTLVKIDPTVNSRTNLISLGAAQAQLHSAGQTSNWTATDRETQIATVLGNAIPSLMMSLMIGAIHFRCTNDSAGSEFQYQIIDGRTLSNLDLRQNFNIMMSRLEREVMFDVTFGNNVRYTLDVSAHLFAETRIKLSLDYGGTYEYTIPSFCDSVTSPVIADNAETFHGIVNTVDLLANAISLAVAEARPSTNVITERF